MCCFRLIEWLTVAAATVVPGMMAAAAEPQFEPAEVTFDGRPGPAPSSAVCGFALIAAEKGPQLAVMEPAGKLLAAVGPGARVEVAVTMHALTGPVTISALASLDEGDEAEATLALGDQEARALLGPRRAGRLEVSGQAGGEGLEVRLGARGTSGEAAVRFSRLELMAGGRRVAIPLEVPTPEPVRCPPPNLPGMRPAIERALIEWDWRMQDGIGTERVPSTYSAAVRKTLERGDRLIRDLRAAGVPLADLVARWEECRTDCQSVAHRAESQSAVHETDWKSVLRWEDLWREIHQLRRRIALSNPLAQTGPLLFVKRAPSIFSHQLTQYYGASARPGGGVFVLVRPGESMECRKLAPRQLPLGAFQHPEVSFDGRRVLFAYCRTATDPKHRSEHLDRFYHLWEMGSDGSGLRQLTDGPFDDFSPRYLPDGRILFVSTRRGGFHRCGRGPCPVYTLAIAESDGSHPHPISYHETHEWDPAVLHDGRVIYTRWDYVDRHAVHYQQLWTARPDGSDVRIFYGNNTLNPVGTWEARPVPGSARVMATAAAHHAMTAGSIVLLDTRRGVDGPEPITRLTPDALFPESETRVEPHWHAPVGVKIPPPVPDEARRWPGHCYRSPNPLSETYFLAAYSFAPLRGEPLANPVNMFGIYLVDRFGNKELLYRDLNISSQWPTPLRARVRPAVLPSPAESAGANSGNVGMFAQQKWDHSPPVDEKADDKDGARGSRISSAPPEGTVLLQNVYQSWPPLPEGPVRRLRIVQVLPKTTPHSNSPRVGLANASPGKQVLGTVPVEADGSAYFRVPAGVPVSFQALDPRGRAVQTMRSLTYLQPGETLGCVGCHEPRLGAPPPGAVPLALGREPSAIEPGPPGSKPLCYPILVQPVLDEHCVACHSRAKPDGGVVLTGEPQGAFSASYHALAARVPFSAWGGGDFRRRNSEPLTMPDHFGARASPLVKLLDEGHYDVALSRGEYERLFTWMDANALFYGTFDPADQARQLRGERIAGPKLE